MTDFEQFVRSVRIYFDGNQASTEINFVERGLAIVRAQSTGTSFRIVVSSALAMLTKARIHSVEVDAVEALADPPESATMFSEVAMACAIPCGRGSWIVVELRDPRQELN